VATVAVSAGLLAGCGVLRVASRRRRAARPFGLRADGPRGTVRIGSDATIQSLNRSARHLFGFRADEVIGRHITILLPDIGPALARRRPLDVYQTTTCRLVIAQSGRHKDGSRLLVQLTLRELRGTTNSASAGYIITL
jgi:PAS domain S-box-containing protein